MRRIDADALIEKLNEKAKDAFRVSDEYETILTTLIEVQDIVDNAPTIEAGERREP